MGAGSSLWRLPLQQGEENTVFLDCISSLIKSKACENRTAWQPHAIDGCSGQLPPLTTNWLLVGKATSKPNGTFSFHSDLYIKLWVKLGFNRAQHTGRDGPVSYQRLPKFPEKKPQTHHQTPPAPQSQPLAFTKSDGKKKMKSPVEGLNHLLSLCVCHTQGSSLQTDCPT